MFGRHALQSHDFAPKMLRWQTLCPEPKKKVFLALGYNLHLELASRCTFSVRASCRAKPRLRTQNASQNVRPETGKQHGLASSRTPFFDLRWSDLQCQTSRPEPIKKRGFCSCGAQFAPPIAFEMHRWHLQLRLGVTMGKTTTSDPKAFPKRLAPEQGNSMAWRAQGHRFSTSVGMSFNVKRCVQNL